MADSRSKNVSRNITFAFANKMISILLPFASRTIILYLLGDQYLGIGSLFTSILSFLSLTELGLGSAIVFSMYKPIAEEDEEKICALLAYYKKLYRRIGLVMITIGTILLPMVPYLIKGKPPAGVNVYLLFYIYLINSVISYFFAGYKQSLLTAHQRTDIISKVTLTVNVLIQTGQIAALVLTKNFYVYALVPILGTVLTNIYNCIIVNKKYPQYRCRGSLKKEDVKAIESRLGGLVGTKMSSIVMHSADTVVISAVLGLTATAIYDNYYLLLNAVSSFVIVFFSSMTASVGNSIITESKEKNYKLFQQLQFVNAWITGWCSVCLICLYHPFMLLWVGEKRCYSIGIEITLVVYFFLYTVQRVILLFKDAGGIWYQDRYRPYICMVMNIVLNCTSVHFIGIYGVIGSSVLTLGISIPWVNHVVFHTLFINGEERNLLDLGFYTVVTVIAAGVTYAITVVLPQSVVGLLIRGSICLVVPNLIFLLGYSGRPEFVWAYKMVSVRLKKILGRERRK